MQDVQADLATEVDEDRAEAQRKMTEAAKRETDSTEAPTELDPVPMPRGKPGAFEKGSKSEVTLEPANHADAGDPTSMPGEEVDLPEPDDVELNTGMEAQEELSDAPTEPVRVDAIPKPPPKERLSTDTQPSSAASAPSSMAILVPVVLAGGAILLLLTALTFALL